MITRVYGTANAAEINFDHIDGDLWQAQVPYDSSGTFVCALYAENDIGNRAFICKALWAIVGHQMKMFILDSGYKSTPEESGYVGDPELEEFVSKFADLLYASGLALKLEFAGRLIERGYRSEYILCDRAKGR